MLNEQPRTGVWVPEGLAERLVVGARVRWRKNPECTFRCEGCGADLHGHYSPNGEGVIDEIAVEPKIVRHDMTNCDARSGMQGHEYRVYVETMPNVDQSISIPEKHGFWAAAIELTPLDTE